MPGTTAYIALGGNLGDVERTFADALRHLSAMMACESLRASRLYRTEPWGEPDQPEYLNLVAEMSWTDTADMLAKMCFALEKRAGRDRTVERRYGPRTLDIDILTFGDATLSTEELIIPHPEMAKRRFVLAPFFDLAPDLVPPGWQMTVEQALSSCPDEGYVIPVSGGHWKVWLET